MCGGGEGRGGGGGRRREGEREAKTQRTLHDAAWRLYTRHNTQTQST